MKIRKATPNEWEIVKQLNIELFESDYQFDEYLNLSWPDSKAGIKYFKESVEKDSMITLVAEVGSEIVGYLIGSSPKTSAYLNKKVRFAYLENVYIKNDFRRQGIGKELFETFEEWAKARGCDVLEVRTYFENSNAVEFYSGVGFKNKSIVLSKSLKK